MEQLLYLCVTLSYQSDLFIQGFPLKKFESKPSYNWGAMFITNKLVRVKLLSIGNHSNTLVTGCSKDARTHEKEEGWDFEIYGREGNQFGRLQGNYIRVMILWWFIFFLLFDAYINQLNSPCVGALLNLTVSCLLHWNCNRKCCSDACQGSYSQTRLL